MRRLRVICAWIVVVAIVLASPVASLGECLRCPPDCPMHAQRVETEHGAGHGSAPRDHAHEDHAQHGLAHPGGHGAAQDTVGAPPQVAAAHHAGARRCHEAPAPEPEDGPCLSGVCGHMDPSLARALPDAVLFRPALLAPRLLEAQQARAAAPSLASLPSPPPTEPPRPLAL